MNSLNRFAEDLEIGHEESVGKVIDLFPLGIGVDLQEGVSLAVQDLRLGRRPIHCLDGDRQASLVGQGVSKINHDPDRFAVFQRYERRDRLIAKKPQRLILVVTNSGAGRDCNRRRGHQQQRQSAKGLGSIIHDAQSPKPGEYCGWSIVTVAGIGRHAGGSCCPHACRARRDSLSV
jgi:hypothetical protein